MEDGPFHNIPVQKDIIHQVVFDTYGKRIATCSSDTTLTIWDKGSDGKWYRTAHWKVHGGAVWRVVWAHAEFGQIIATCSYDRSVSIWSEQFARKGDTIDRNEKVWVRRAIFSGGRANITDLAFAPRHLGLMLALVTTAGTLKIYEVHDVMDLVKWEHLHDLQAFHTRCGCVTWSKSRIHRPLIAVGSDEKKSESTERIVIYEYNEGMRKWFRVKAFKVDLPGPVTDLRFSPITNIESHQIAICCTMVVIYNVRVARASILGDEALPIGQNPVTAEDYTAVKVQELNDYKKAWRIRYNVTGTDISISYFDGSVASWKMDPGRGWKLASEVTPEDYAHNKRETSNSKFVSDTLRNAVASRQ